MPSPDPQAALCAAWPDKCRPPAEVFARIRRGDRIFVGTGCGEPQFLVQALADHVRAHPKAFFDTQLFQVWTLGVAPYLQEKFEPHFRHNSFFVGDNTREAVNRGLADYTPVFLSQVPDLFRRGLVPVNVALIQATPPDAHGYLNLGVSVDIVKAAVDAAELIIAQVNPRLPRVAGDGFLPVERVDYLLWHEELPLEFESFVADDVAARIGGYVARLVQDGDTIQVGYGATPNAILAALGDKRHLGVHTELLSDGIVELMRRGVVDNARKTRDRGKTVAAFCMGRAATYEYIDGHPGIELRGVDYTNDPLVIAQQRNMTAINSALQVDLTGQASAESIGKTFYSGIGGQADFMRGAVLAPGGKTILALQSTACGGTVSRIVPFLAEGAGVTLNRGDVHYVVTEYGIAHIHGKNVRERAMDLIAIAHPDFRAGLTEAARALNLVYADQVVPPRGAGSLDYLETARTTRSGLPLVLRQVRVSDEPLLRDFFNALSDRSLESRFATPQQNMPHHRLQRLIDVDGARELVLLAVLREPGREAVIGLGEYYVDERAHTAEVAFAVRDEYQNRGVGTELLRALILVAKKAGLHGFTAEVLEDNKPMLHLFQKMKFDIEYERDGLVYNLAMTFRED